MRRRAFLAAGAGARWLHAAAGPPPIRETHFPSRLYQFVWRNWELANADRMAEVLGTSARNVLELGASMGLPRKRVLTSGQLRRIYITVIRQNWHLLPESQIVQLLGWDREKFAFTLKEDDFLDVKLSRPKPECAELKWRPPAAAEREAAARMRKLVRGVMGPGLDATGQDLFHFVQELSDARTAPLRAPGAQAAAGEIDVSRGWRIEPPAGETLRHAATRLEEYLRTAMAAAPGAAHTIRLAVERGAPESFAVRVAPGDVTITGGDEAGVLQGVYWLQDQMEAREGPFLQPGVTERKTVWSPRYLYSYVALYGDPLMDTDIDPFPGAYLEKLARAGINGVWIQAVLNTLAPSRHFPEFGAGWQTRLKNLNAMVRRAKQYGMKVFLYLNEPRAMPAEFFRHRPGIQGARYLDLFAMCTSTPVVREWIGDSLAHVMRHAPDLGGWFSITMSENHTNCYSHGGAWGERTPVIKDCPRCAPRPSWEVIGELLQTFRDGVRRESRTAEVIAWDWGWGHPLAERLIPLLPRDMRYMSISEWDTPVDRGGVRASVGEYSISVVGPGPRATRNWQRAARSGIRRMAKLQFNNTWEISAVPYIPVPHLIVEHCERLGRAGLSGIMPSWTCGGYPSPNLAAAKAYYFEPRASRDEILSAVARQRYGAAAAPDMLEGWRLFSEAFQEFPYGVHVYIIPTQHGPANLLRFEPTGCKPSMILMPQDDVKAWSGAYPPQVAQSQFARLAARWNEGLAVARKGLGKVTGARRAWAEMDLAIAETCYHHFQSTANQMEFYILRDQQGGDRRARLDRMRAIAEQEIELARRQFGLARRQATIAYEATNHYYYTPLDLVEKILNCREVIERCG